MSREIRPWDIFVKSNGKVIDAIKKSRLEVCNGCEFFLKKVNVCSQCGCYMLAKASISEASCPINKWGPYTLKEEREKDNVK